VPQLTVAVFCVAEDGGTEFERREARVGFYSGDRGNESLSCAAGALGSIDVAIVAWLK
jgi:hypothetical protein